jgi:hypothetical protein
MRLPRTLGVVLCLLLAGARAHALQTGAAAQSWQPVGPSQILTQNYGAVSGRVTSVAIDPVDASGNTVYLGTAGGGVWKSTNAAASGASGNDAIFAPLTDTLLVFNNGEATASLAVGAVTVQPGGTGVVLAGTGEANPAGDAHYGEGLLRSADGGQTWTLVQSSHDGVGGNHSFTGEGFAAFAWGPGSGDVQTVVAAVGLPGGSAQVGAVTLGASVRGLYASQDAGQTWQLATIQDMAADGSLQTVQGPQTDYAAYDGNSALTIAWNPLRQLFFAAVQGHGLYQSADGLTWTRLSMQPGSALSLSSCPTDPGYAAAASCPMQQAALAVNLVTGDTFVWFVDADGNDQGLWQDVCAAQQEFCANTVTFSSQIGTVALEIGAGAVTGGPQGLALAVIPGASGTDAKLLAAANSLAVCDLAGGCAWQTNCAANAQPGVRAVGTASGSQVVLLGTEGGLWRSADAGGSCSATDFANLNSGLGPLAPLESVADLPGDASVLLAGAGELGTAGTQAATGWSAAGGTASAWPQLAGGEGGNVALDADGVAYLTLGAGVQIGRCASGAQCAAGDFPLAIGAAQVGDDQSLEHAPFALDAADSAQILAGTCRVWRGPADGVGWTAANAISPMFDGNQQASCNGNTLVRSVAGGGPSAAAGSQVVYAGMQGLALNQYGAETPNAGHLFVTTNAQNATGSIPWTDIALSPVTNAGVNNGVFNASQFDVSSIAVDAHDPTGGTVYATIYGLHVAHVYRSTDFGAHWLNVSANLPDVPVSAVVVDPNDANTIYVGTDTGVYFTQAITQCAQQDCWQQHGATLPNTVVTALAADGATGLLRAATRGRGAWQIPLATGSLASQTTAAVSPDSLTFPATQVSTVSGAQTMTVAVTGVNALSVTSVAVTGDFSETDSCTGTAVAVGATCKLQVAFAPTQTGTRSGTVTIYGNLPGGQAGPFALSGTGLSAPQVVLSPSGTLSFGDVTLGQTSAAQLVEVANTGQTSATLSSFNVTGDFAIAQNTCGSTLAATTGCAVGVTFTPTQRGAETGTFSVTDSSGTQALELTGTGQAAASLALSPAALAFPATNIGSASAIQSVTVTNSGDLSAAITGISASGEFAVTNGCAQSVAGDSSCTLGVTFLPTQAGTRTGTVTLLTGFQTLTAQLSGTGVGTPLLTLTPPTLSFGAENVGQTSAAQSMTLTNSGNGPDTITSITTSTATPGTVDYPVSSNCGTLVPGASCTITVAFRPGVAGEDDGTLNIAASVAGSAVTAQLTGSGNSLAWMSGQSPSATVPAGQTASYALQLQVVGYTGAVATACTGLPVGATCVWQPTTMVQEGQGSVMFSVSTGPDAVAALGGWRIALALCLPWIALPLRRKKAWLLLAASLLLAGCGAASSRSPGGATVAPGTYTFTVTASGGGMTSALPVTLVVE